MKTTIERVFQIFKELNQTLHTMKSKLLTIYAGLQND